LEQLSAGLGLTNVKFVGHIREAELDHAIAGSRFTVLPSHAYETLGKTILESYAHGRAVVASDLGSRRELIHEGKTGLLYGTGDVSQLTSALKFLSSQPELADEMGRAGRELVEKLYTPEAHYEVLIGLYERLAAGEKRSGRDWNASSNKAAQIAVAETKTFFGSTCGKWLCSASAPRIVFCIEPCGRVTVNCVSETNSPHRLHWWARCDFEVQRN